MVKINRSCGVAAVSSGFLFEGLPQQREIMVTSLVRWSAREGEGGDQYHLEDLPGTCPKGLALVARLVIFPDRSCDCPLVVCSHLLRVR